MEQTLFESKKETSMRLMRESVHSNAEHKITIQWSGGRDSHALVQLYEEMPAPKPELRILTVNTGDWPQETHDRLRLLKSRYEVHVIHSNSRDQRARCGDPFDIVVQNDLTDLTAEQTPFACCWNNIMKPMHLFMLNESEDSVVCRGVKACDKVPESNMLQIGDVYSICNPLWNWTQDELNAYLKDTPTFYLMGACSGVDCVSCTAYIKHNNRDYMKAFYPENYKKIVNRVRAHTQKVKNLLGNYPAEFSEDA